MQHKTIGKVTETVKDAKPLEFKSMAGPVEQWDHLAFSVVYQELAPKGFKKFQNGHWKGAEHADIPFLSKKQVIKTQKMAAQLVRGYRDKAKAQVKDRIAFGEAALKLSKWWEFRRKAELNTSLVVLRSILENLDNTPIK